jgi:hypothetical protein
VPAGVPGSLEVRALAVSDALWLIAGTVLEREYSEAALQRGLRDLDWVGRRAMAHEAVVEHFLSAPAVVPMQLFTLFASDERAVEHVVRDRRRLARILPRIERQLEWGIRLTWDERAARETVDRRHAKGPRSGASYLARKRDLLDVGRVQLKAARAEADRFFRAMTREASQSRRRMETEQAAPGSRLLLDAAFLVPAQRKGAFRAAVQRSAKKLGKSGVSLSLTGPWPPYNFI